MTVKVFFYKLGSKNNREDYVNTLVPYKINEKKLFFGPCKKEFREAIRGLYLRKNNVIDLNQPEILEKYGKTYVVGIGKLPKDKDKASNFVFAGRIERIFTFQEAWHYYHGRKDTEQGVREMINGHGNPRKSPLHLKPIPEQEGAELEGYEHHLHEHDKNWVSDILSMREINIYKKKLNLSHLRQEEFLDEIYKKDIDRIYKEEGITFERDCCFSMENIFFSKVKKLNPIPIDDFFIEKMTHSIEKKMGANRLEYLYQSRNENKPNKNAPLGYYIVKGQRIRFPGKGQVYEMEGEDAKEFIEHLDERLNKNTSIKG